MELYHPENHQSSSRSTSRLFSGDNVLVNTVYVFMYDCVCVCVCVCMHVHTHACVHIH